MSATATNVIELELEASSLIESAKFEITNQEQYEAGAAYAKSVKSYLSKVGEAFDPIISAAHKAHTTAIAQKKVFTDKADQALKIVKQSMSAYIAEQERIKREAQAKFLEEQRQRDEEAKRQREAELALGIELDITEQVEIETYGPIAEVGPAIDKAGVKYRDVYKFEITDLNAIPRQYLMPNDVMIGGVVRSTKGAVAIPGVRVIVEKVAII